MPTESVNWLLLGTGDIVAKRVGAALAGAPGSRLAAVCGRNAERAQAVAARFGVEKFYTDFGEALATSGADAVYIATPVDLHVPQAIAALDAGKHVLVEKPLGLDIHQCAPAVVKAKQTGLVAGCAYYRRCFPCFRYTQEMLKRGEFGEIIHIGMNYYAWFNPAREDPKYWRVVKSQSGGGPLADMGSHMIDVMIGLVGMPRRVYAKAATLTHPYKVEDSADVLMELANGAQATGEFHWNSNTWTHEFEIVGTEARLRWSPFDSGKLIKTVGRDALEVSLPNAGNVHQPLVEDFVQAIRENHAPAAPFAEAAQTSRVLDAIYESSRLGREIGLKPAAAGS